MVPPPSRAKSPGIDVLLGVVLTLVGAGLADVVVVWTGVLVKHTQMGAALIGFVAAVVPAHRWAAARASTTVWWSCGLVLVALAGLAGYAWQRIGMSPISSPVLRALVPLFPVATCTSIGTGYLWRLCERLLIDHRGL
ncbi:hypothetical protein [Cutibacterium granulosum]|uniref:hypothetical protein n=1 Tax=Cutibacterium granulosum TaxID=33011 RepID=UPI002B22CAD6|nr:hypothetical protein [Cutibacterium granulosum]MEA5649926.1 hypothetical protein [Cutibacterium granulosum]